MTKAFRAVAVVLLLASTGLGAIEASAAPVSPIPKPSQPTTKKQQDGLNKCIDWCLSHNKTANSQAQCSANCENYWSTHQG